jgi:alpha,alpha-trehalose phosphorylase
VAPAHLPIAKERAQELGLQGAAFPWRTIRGRESSGYWPASTAAFHINADIADAVVRYVDATGDEEFERTVGLDLLVETARLWRSLGHHDNEGRFRIDGVTGPDEYSSIADNNIYTNLMAEQNLRAAAETAGRHPERAAEHGVTTEEMASWRDAAEAMIVPYDEKLDVHPQSEGFTNHAVWDFAGTTPDKYPLLLHFPYFDLYRKQVVKQADLVLALHRRGDRFSFDEKDRDFRYYEALTVRDSSLSACTQAVVAAELGYLELAHDYLAEAALMDMEDRAHNTRDGLQHGLAGRGVTALVEGLGGMRARDGRLSFGPRLPAGLSRLSFRVCYRGSCLVVTTDGRTARYRVREGPPIELIHHGEAFEVGEDEVERRIEPLPARPRPHQPPAGSRNAGASRAEPAFRQRAAGAQVMSSMRWSAMRAPSAVSGSTVIWLTTRPATSSSSTQARWGSSMRFMVEHGQMSGSSDTTVLSGCSWASRLTRWISVPMATVDPAGAASSARMM